MVFNYIVNGDCFKLAKQIPDASVDLIFTDPVYSDMLQYQWLGNTAMRVLKPNSALLVWTTSNYMFEVKKLLEKAGLVYQWTLYYVVPGKSNPLHGYGIYPGVTPCLFFTNGKKKAAPYITDYQISTAPADGSFKWNKNEAVVRRWLLSFTRLEDTVYDPFCGEGTVAVVCKTTGRSCISHEIDPLRAETANLRLLNTPPPLFLLEPEQTRMELEQ